MGGQKNDDRNSKENELDSAWEDGIWAWGNLPEMMTFELGQEGEWDLDGAGWQRIDRAVRGIKPVCAGRSTWLSVSGGRLEGSSRCSGGGQNLKCLECYYGEFKLLFHRQKRLSEAIKQSSHGA